MAGKYYERPMASSGDFIRVRKPPGGDTHDIFNLERRQREHRLAIYTDSRTEKSVGFDGRKCLETEDIPTPKCNAARGKLRRSLSEGKLQTDIRSPALAAGKENVGTHFKRCSSPGLIVKEGKSKRDDESEDEADDELGTLSNRRPPIAAGIVTEEPLSQLEDATNVEKNAKPLADEAPVKMPRRSCIRVRQPPGGKSSIIF